MLIIMKQQATKVQIDTLVAQLSQQGIKVYVNQEQMRTVLGLVGDPQQFKKLSLHHAGIETTVTPTVRYPLTSRMFRSEDTIVDVNGVKIGGAHFAVIAGPCAVESLAQIRACARIAKAGGATILRGGAFKPRTSPYAFQGLEEEGLIYLRQAADEYEMQVITEVMDEAHLDMIAQYSDILQIGARNMQNFKLLQAVGKIQKPVALKRGMAATIEEWLNAAEYIAAQGNFQIIFVERGIRTFETATRNTLDLSAVPLIKKLSHFPILVDPSHGVGIWDLVPPMARAGVAAGADGLMIEIHPEPANAWSDGPQSLNEKTYLNTMHDVHVLEKAMRTIRASREGASK